VVLGRICPGCSQIIVGTCPNGCVTGRKRLTPRRRRNQKVWSSSAHRKQRLRVLARDDYTCQKCGWRDETETGKNLVADHVYGIDERDVYNDEEMQTLCLPHSGQKAGCGHG
jgi:5-methylcytosine-specific restriction endonuclease McrA